MSLGICIAWGATTARERLIHQDRKLQEVLKKHLPVPVTPNSQPSQKSWDDLYDKISTEEAQFIGTGQSSLRLFWYKLGERKEGINAWFGLIPDEYGLSVVKAAVALTLQVIHPSCAIWPEHLSSRLAACPRLVTKTTENLHHLRRTARCSSASRP